MVFVQVVLLAINPYIFYNQSVTNDILNKVRFVNIEASFVMTREYDIADFYVNDYRYMNIKLLYTNRELRRYKNEYVHGYYITDSIHFTSVIQYYYIGLYQPVGLDMFKFAVDVNFVPHQGLIEDVLIFMFNIQSNTQAMEYLLDTYLYLYLPTLPTEIVSELMSMNISCSRPWFDGEVISLTRGFRYKIEINRAKNIFIFDTLHYLITTQDLDLSENPGKFEKLLVTIKEVGVNINWPYLYKKAAFYRTNIRYKDLIKAIYAATKYFPIDSEQRDIIIYRDR